MKDGREGENSISCWALCQLLYERPLYPSQGVGGGAHIELPPDGERQPMQLERDHVKGSFPFKGS